MIFPENTWKTPGISSCKRVLAFFIYTRFALEWTEYLTCTRYNGYFLTWKTWKIRGKHLEFHNGNWMATLLQLNAMPQT